MFPEQKRQCYRFGDFEVDVSKRSLLCDKQPVPLNPKAFDLLTALLENHGQVVTKDELLKRVWPNQFVEEGNLTVHISSIRKALSESKTGNRYVATVPGRGYSFVAELDAPTELEIVVQSEEFKRIVIEQEIETAEPGQHGPGLKPEPAGSVFWNRKYLVRIGMMCAISLVLVGYVWQSGRRINGSVLLPNLSLTRLTTNGKVNLAVLSPDGKFFAYSAFEAGDFRTEIRIGQTNGNSDISLLPMSDTVKNPTAFSADGNWLYYVESGPRENNDGTLFKIPVLGGVTQRLLSGINIYPAVSPNEKQIAFVRNKPEDKMSALVVANIYDRSERELVVRTLDQAIGGLSLSWSTEGALIAFSTATGRGESHEVFVANVIDGTVTQLTALDWRELAHLEWMKDGSGLLAVAKDKDSTASTQIWQIDYPAGKAQRITRDLSHYGSALNLSAASGAFVVVQVNRESNLWLAAADNLAVSRQITFGSLERQDGWYGLDWTPDGGIVYVAKTDQSLTLWRMDADGANTRQLTAAGFQDRSPSVSSDGQFTVFLSNRSGRNEIWRISLDGSDLSQLTVDGGNSAPSITPDGKWVVYQHKTDSENSVWRIPVTGGESVRITDKESHSPRVSPDGKFVACGYFVAGKTKLAVVPINGGAPVHLFDVPQTYNFDAGAIRWSPDGRFISYRDWANGVWQQSIEGGEPVRLAGLPAEKLYAYGWSRDGKQFAFARGREARDVVLIRDFR